PRRAQRPRTVRPFLGPVRRQDRGPATAAPRRCLAHEYPLAAHRDCDRRPGDIRAARGVPSDGWLSRDPADGRHRALQTPQTRELATVPARARHHLRSALGTEWRAQANGPDVAVAARLFLRCRSEKARAAIRL